MPRRAKAVALPAAHAPALGSAAAPRARGRRVHFVDLLRLVASFQMVQGHTVDALLADELRRGAAFDRWTWVRGLTSVSFMVAAGMSFHLSTLARFEAHVADPAAVHKRFRRGAWLVVLGYLLHFPAGLFGGDAAAAARALEEFQIADVLQCIGLSILLLEAMTVVAKRPRQVVMASLVLAAFAFLAAPLTDAVAPEGPWRFALAYVTHRGGSLFPLLPWAGYVFAGVVAAEVALPHGARTRVERPSPRLLGCAAIAIALAGAVMLAPPFGEPASHNAALGPNLLKLGVVLAFIATLALLSQRITALPRPLTVLSGETLMLYVFHLLVLYAGGVGLSRTVGHTLSLGEAAAAAVVMIVLTAAVGLGWSRLVRAWRARRGSTALSDGGISDGGISLDRSPSGASRGGVGS